MRKGNAPMTSSRIGRWRLPAALVGMALVMAGCASDAPQDTLKPEGPVARQIDNLFVPVFLVAAVIFVIVQGAIVYIMWRYRRRPETADVVPKQTHGNTRLEIGWTILPAVIMFAIMGPTIATILDLAKKPDNALEVTVVGQQWWWEYQYDTNGDGTADVITANELHIPVDQPVYLTLKSRDVIHSFWVPRLAGKKDVAPGRTHHLTIEAEEPGAVYLGQCVEFCGASHANMRLKVFAHDRAGFDAWLAEQSQPARTPDAGTLAATGADLFTARGCAGCHTINGVSVAPEPNPPVQPAAPNLTHVASRTSFAGAIFPLDTPHLKRWLRNPPGEKDGSRMPNLHLSEDDIDALVAYLLSLQ